MDETAKYPRCQYLLPGVPEMYMYALNEVECNSIIVTDRPGVQIKLELQFVDSDKPKIRQNM